MSGRRMGKTAGAVFVRGTSCVGGGGGGGGQCERGNERGGLLLPFASALPFSSVVFLRAQRGGGEGGQTVAGANMIIEHKHRQSRERKIGIYGCALEDIAAFKKSGEEVGEDTT